MAALFRVLFISLLVPVGVWAQMTPMLKCQLMISDTNSKEIESSADSSNVVNNGLSDLKMNYGLVDIHAIQVKDMISIQLVDNMKKVDFTTSGIRNAFATYQLTPDHILNVGCSSTKAAKSTTTP